MKVLIFGATGMIGQGALRESLLDPQIDRVTVVGRSRTGQHHPKLREVVHANLDDLGPILPQLAGHDACFFCVGVSSAGLSEAEYTRVTHDLRARADHRQPVHSMSLQTCPEGQCLRGSARSTGRSPAPARRP